MKKLLLAIVSFGAVLPVSAYADEYVYSYTGLPFGPSGPSPIEGSLNITLASNGPSNNDQIFSSSYLSGADLLSWTITGGFGFDTLSSANPLDVLNFQMDIYSGSVFDWNIEATGPEGGASGSSYYRASCKTIRQRCRAALDCLWI